MKELSVSELLNELRIARSNLACLVDKAWELGGCYMGDEDDFNNLADVKDARDQIERIDEIERTFYKK